MIFSAASIFRSTAKITRIIFTRMDREYEKYTKIRFSMTLATMQRHPCIRGMRNYVCNYDYHTLLSSSLHFATKRNVKPGNVSYIFTFLL